MKFEQGPVFLGAGVAAIFLSLLFAPAGAFIGAFAAIMGKFSLDKMSSGAIPDTDIAHVKIGFALGIASIFIGVIVTMVAMLMIFLARTSLGRFFSYVSISM